MKEANSVSALLGAYCRYYQGGGKYLRFLTWLSFASCILATWIIFEGLAETQRFSLSQARDLQASPATFESQLSFNRLGAYSSLEQILLFVDGVKFQVWIALGLLVRSCGLLIKTKRGVLIAQLGLLFSAGVMFKYLFWSLNLLNCDSCTQKAFLLAIPLKLSYPYLLILLIILTLEIGLLARFVFDRSRWRPNTNVD